MIWLENEIYRLIHSHFHAINFKRLWSSTTKQAAQFQDNHFSSFSKFAFRQHFKTVCALQSMIFQTKESLTKKKSLWWTDTSLMKLINSHKMKTDFLHTALKGSAFMMVHNVVRNEWKTKIKAMAVFYLSFVSCLQRRRNAHCVRVPACL